MTGKCGSLLMLLALSGLRCAKEEAALDIPFPGSVAGREVPGAEPESDGVVRLSPDAQERIEIRVEQAQLREVRSVLKAMGRIIAPQHRTAIVSHVLPGRITEVMVRVGDWVKRGQPLVTLECPDVGDAKCEFYKALANNELAKLNLEREQGLATAEIGAKKDLITAETDHKVAGANLDAAERKLHVLGFTEEEVKEISLRHQISPTISLSSPIDGKVVESRAAIGAMVDQSKEILTIIDPKILWVDAEIYEKDLARVRIGEKVEITVPAYPETLFVGTISYMGDVVSDTTRTVTVRTEVANEDYRLKPGMFASVAIILDETSRMLAVPAAAVLEEGPRRILFVQQGGQGGGDFHRRDVQTGPANGEYQYIVSGVAEGEHVVTQGNHELYSKLKEEILRTAHTH